MSYFFDFFYTNDEKQASPVDSKVEEKITRGEGNHIDKVGSQAYNSKMGSASRKGGWLESWQFWKRSDNSGGPFGLFRRGNRPTGSSTARKEENEAYKPAKECDRGEGSKDANPDKGFAERGTENGQLKAAKNTTQAAVETKDCGSSSACASASENGRQSPLVVYNERPNGGKDVALNMKKVEALKNKKSKNTPTKQGNALRAGVRDEKHSPTIGQVQSTQVEAVKKNAKGPTSSDKTVACFVGKPKDSTARTNLKAVRQLPAVASNNVQKRGGSTQAVPASTATTPRAENVPKLNCNSADKKHIERKPTEDKNVHKQNEMGKVCETKTPAVAKRKVALNQAIVPRGNWTKIDEKPSISSGASKNPVGNEVKQTDAWQVVKRKNINPSVSPAQETGNLRNVATAGCLGLNNPTSSPKHMPNNAPGANNPSPALARKIPLVNQRFTRQQNPASPVNQKWNVLPMGQKTGAKPPMANQGGKKVPQSSKVPQSCKSHDLQCPQSGTQEPRCAPGRQCPSGQSPTATRNLQSKPVAPAGSKTLVSNAQIPDSQQSPGQNPMPQKNFQQNVVPQNPSQIGPPVKRAYSEVAKQPASRVSSLQTPSQQRNRPEGASQQTTLVQGREKPKQPANRRRAPGLAKPVIPAGETPPGNGETTRHDPTGSGNVSRKRIVYLKDGRKFTIECNKPENLARTAVKNSQGNKNAPEPKHELLAKQENLKPVVPVMKDASTSTCPQSTVVDAAVQVPDEEGNVGDEIQSLLVKRPWDTERVMKMQVLLDEKLVVIGRMRETSRKQRDELKTTRKRCKELETVIKASNMQGKPQLVAQVNELTEIKNELVTEVTNLTVDLEKERTNVKNLRTELVEVKAQLTAARRKGANATNQ